MFSITIADTAWIGLLDANGVLIALTCVTKNSTAVHPEPIWRHRSDFIIRAALPEPGRFEQLWSRKVGDDTFEICCIPFFLYDLALGDVVQTSPHDGREYVLSRVLEQSGRYVFRAHFEPSMRRFRDDITAGLEELGALMEWSSPTLVAVDAHSPAHARQIAGFLRERSEQGQLMYETGHTA
ncbi:DUF4265 domain-containing protein [Phytoactinopolyspora alkaliphila]|uniref:DUF4265 domain-containing protein n=2 Tax=Phytoactinopolyspora alkaliphila TaxID=1783498 RepID=A0A6N9YQ09_9ACTN|nr:DUF4265 domain-containing protein [Phytoactinopolyspora alkaliphila]NED97136.1 DUF4265 domain-containing protein [Phytoactinopolyspora alkaliphila]